MALTYVKSSGLDTSGDFVANSLTLTANIVSGNANLGNAVTANYFIGNGSQLTGLPAGYTDTNANSAIDARVTQTFVNNLNINSVTLNGHSDTYFATQTDVSNAVANLVASAPAALDTLNELANALGNDASYSTTITNALANKLSTSSFATTADTWLATKTTTDVSEGTNLYYTATRANSSIDARVTKTFVDNLSVVANIANIAYSVSVANVTGIGNIATINKDGNSSNVLYGNGVFAAAPSGGSGGSGTPGGSNTQLQYNNNGSFGGISTVTFDGTSLSLGDVANIKIAGGTDGQVLRTDGTGNLTWTTQSSGTGGTGAAVEVTLSTFTGDGSTVSFQLPIAPSAKKYVSVHIDGIYQLNSSYGLSNDTIVLSEAPDVDSVIEIRTSSLGTALVSTNDIVAAGANTQVQFNDSGLFAGVASFRYNKTSSTLFANNFAGNGALVTGVMITTNAQPNITSVGTLTTLSVAGNTSITGEVTIGGAAKVSGSLYVNSINDANGTSTITANLSGPGSVGIQSHLTVGAGGNGNLTVTGNTVLGDVSTVHISGGTAGQLLTTNGSGNISWSSPFSYMTRNYVANGNANSFTVSSSCTADSILLFINGICQAPTQDYTVASGVVTLDAVPIANSKIQIRELPRY